MFYLRHRKWCPRQTSSQTGRSESEGFTISVLFQTSCARAPTPLYCVTSEFPPLNSGVADPEPARILTIYNI
jgi:hypothetical protein